MRILLVHPGPEFSVADVFNGYAEGFAALGHTVRGFNMNDRLAFYTNAEIDGRSLDVDDAATLVNKHLLAKCYEFAPDLIVVVSGFFISEFTWQLWTHRPSNVVCLFTESPYEEDKQLRTAQTAEPSLVVVNDPTNLDRYRQLGLTAHYIPHSYRPDIHYPTDRDADIDFAFVGSGYRSRVELFEQVPWGGLRVALAGHWPDLADDSPLRRFLIEQDEAGLDNAATADLYRRSAVSANLYRAARGHVAEANGTDLTGGWAIGPREVELAATGTFFLRDRRGESDLLFPMLPTFDGPEDFATQLRWWLAHDEERNRAAERARNAIVDRTFVSAARRLLALLP
jgi:spore maturation protein CgeB